MWNKPEDCPDPAIHNLVDRGMLPPKDHPLAAQLFSAFKAGSSILSKPEAYRIGNELNRLQARVLELEAGIADVRRDVRASLESLSKQP